MRSVSFVDIAYWAEEFHALECLWRESDSSFTGCVAEVWFESLPSQFACICSRLVGYPVKVAAVSAGPGRFVARVPVAGVTAQVRLGWPSRGSRVWFIQ